MNIQIVDTDTGICTILTQYLEELNHEIRCLMTLEEVLITYPKADLIFIDPSHNKLSQAITKISKLKGIKTCIMSTNLKDKEQYDSHYFLNMPFNLEDLDLILWKAENNYR